MTETGGQPPVSFQVSGFSLRGLSHALMSGGGVLTPPGEMVGEEEQPVSSITGKRREVSAFIFSGSPAA